MCNCIKELEKRLLEKVIKDKTYKKPVERVKAKGTCFSLSDNFKPIVMTEFEVTLKGQIKKPTIDVKNSHCQFCGEEL
jgi:hypothetical protein